MDVSFVPLQLLISFLTDIQVFFALPGYVGDDARTLEPPREGLQCVSCRRPILVPTIDIGHHPILWRLAHCRHPLHLRCLYPVQMGHPHIVDNPGLSRFNLLPA